MDSIIRHYNNGYGNTGSIYIVTNDSLGWQIDVTTSKITFGGYRSGGSLSSDTNCRAYVYYR